MLKKALGIFLVIIVILIFPLISKDRSNPLKDFVGVQLSDLEYSEHLFKNASSNIDLAAMLFTPKGKGPFPIAVFIQGSGYSSRNNVWYLKIVKHLNDQGIAVFLPDKRGSEKSEGEWKGVSIEELATDTESAIKYIKELQDSSISKIGIIGISQGGWIAPVVASRTDSLSFIANISGTLATAEFQLNFEEANNIAQYTYGFLAKAISKLTVKNLKKKESIAALIYFDPLPYWKQIKTPHAFIAYGGNDTNCPVDKSLAIIDAEGLKGLQVSVYPDGRHAILNDSKTAISEVFLKELTDFILQSTK